MVRVAKEVPPFYENIFRKEDIDSQAFLLKDPYTNVRGRPLLVSPGLVGPHDLLGFRNYHIPNIADVVTIGDSQTYGSNVVIDDNWPSQVRGLLRGGRIELYSMAIGGWSAVQYLNIFRHATSLRPRVIVVAYYTGNDPDESVTAAYSSDLWTSLRPSKTMDLSDKPRFPGLSSAPSDNWRTQFKSGLKMTFTPALRLISNDTTYATVRAGYEIIETTARVMDAAAAEAGIGLVLTVIPTKELVYAERIHREALPADSQYLRLVGFEQQNIDRIARAFKSLKHAKYVDVVQPLQEAALKSDLLYLGGPDGHPLAEGYRVIANAVAPVVRGYIAPPPYGLVGVEAGGNGARVHMFLVDKDGVWRFTSRELVAANGWRPENARLINLRDIAGFPLKGVISVVDRRQFGPGRFRHASTPGQSH
ncbi:MAG: SGNH/GDSL hydrolase family protein [Sulfurifustis sp.]